jgi:5-methylcytosine-specific restriction endonuclease McrA
MPKKDPEQRRAYQRAYYAAHKEKIAAQNAQYRARHRDKINAKKAAYYQANRAKLLEKCKQYVLRNAEKHKAYHAAYRAKHRDRINAAYRLSDKAYHNARQKSYVATHHEHVRAQVRTRRAAHRESVLQKEQAYREAHREQFNEKEQRRRARKAAAPINDLTLAQWQAIKEHYRHCCVYCGRQMERLTQDHIIPLSKGGSHTVQNVVPACRSCNSRKHTGPPLSPIQPLLLVG